MYESIIGTRILCMFWTMHILNKLKHTKNLNKYILNYIDIYTHIHGVEQIHLWN